MTPIEDLSVAVGVQTESTESKVRGHNDLAHGNPPVGHDVEVESKIAGVKVEENIEIRYSGLPFSTVYADISMEQDNYDQFEQRLDHSGDQELLRLTETANTKQSYRVGATVSPCKWFSGNAYYQLSENANGYMHVIDQEATPGVAGDGYSAVITDLETDRNEFAVKLTCRPVHWFRTALKYQQVDSQRDTVTAAAGSTPAGRARSYDYKSTGLSLSASLVPNPKCVVSAVITSAGTETVVPGAAALTTLDKYTGDVLSLLTSAKLQVADATSVNLGYQFADADNDQSNDGGVPATVSYTSHELNGGVNHTFSDTLSGSLSYAYAQFEDAHYLAGAADFTAHSVVASVKKSF